MFYFLLVAGACCALAVVLLLRHKTRQSRIRFKSGEYVIEPAGASALLGHAAHIGDGMLTRQLESWADSYGAIYQIRLGPFNRAIVSADAELNRAVMLRRPSGFRRPKSSDIGIQSLFPGCGLFNAEGDDWRQMRKLTAQCFTKRLIESCSEIVDAHIERLVNSFENKKVVDPKERCLLATLNVIVNLVFGIDVNESGDESGEDWRHFSSMLVEVMEAIGWRAFAPLPWYKNIQTANVKRENKLAKTVAEKVLARVAEFRDGKTRQAALNMLSLLLEEPSFSDGDVLNNAIQIVLAGSDTTGNTMAWLPWLLASDLPLQERLRADIKSSLKPESSLSSQVAALSNLPSVVATARELIRFCPAATMVVLESASEQTLTMADGRVIDIPENTGVFCLNHFAVTHNAAIANANKFNPYRWLEDDAAVRQLHALTRSFGDGPRVCPGSNLAMSELQHFIVRFLLRCRATPAPNYPAPVEKSFFTSAPYDAFVCIELI